MRVRSQPVLVRAVFVAALLAGVMSAHGQPSFIPTPAWHTQPAEKTVPKYSGFVSPGWYFHQSTLMGPFDPPVQIVGRWASKDDCEAARAKAWARDYPGAVGGYACFYLTDNPMVDGDQRTL